MKTLLKQFARRDAHWSVQFVKYALCGGAATVVDVLVFYVLSWKVLPALGADDPLVRLFGLPVTAITDAVRERHFVINSGLAFIFSNFTAYILNVLWVFQPGRHKRHVEIGLFYLVSIVSIVSGTFLGWLMIRYMGMSTSASYLGKMISALLINFVCRKYIIFKG